MLRTQLARRAATALSPPWSYGCSSLPPAGGASIRLAFEQLIRLARPPELTREPIQLI